MTSAALVRLVALCGLLAGASARQPTSAQAGAAARQPASAHEAAIRSSGLGAASPNPPAFPTTTKGVFFAGVFTDHVVLQRAPQKSAVYGVVVGGSAATKVTVGGVGPSPVEALVDASTVALFGYARWKAFLPPMPAGSNFTIKASCTGCTGSTAATIADATFGDVWFCSGQSKYRCCRRRRRRRRRR